MRDAEDVFRDLEQMLQEGRQGAALAAWRALPEDQRDRPEHLLLACDITLSARALDDARAVVLRAAALAAAGVGDPATAQVVVCAVALEAGEIERAATVAQRVRPELAREGDTEREWRVVAVLAEVAARSGRPSEALRLLHEAVALAPPWARVQLWTSIGELHLQSGRLDEGLEATVQSRQYALTPFARARVDSCRAQIAYHAGDVALAEELFASALEVYDEVGSRRMAHSMRVSLADLARERGDLDEAERLLHRAVEDARASGLRGFFPRVNLAWIRHLRGDPAGARVDLEALIAASPPFAGSVTAARHVLLATLARIHDHAAWDAQLQRVQGRHAILSRDVVLAARLSAADWAEKSPSRATRSLALAIRQCRRLGWRTEVDDEALRRLAAFGARPFAGDWDLVAVLGKGAMGSVWLAEDASGRQVAVKVLTSTSAPTRSQVAAFANEVVSAARLDHPAIVRVLDHGRLDRAAEVLSGGTLIEDSPWVAMELASGGTLASGPFAWPQCREALIRVLGALSHAHARGVLHRDLKPSNVLLSRPGDPSSARIADFGLAFAIGHAPDGPALAGTPPYMAPEQLEGRWRDFGPSTDLYAVGCLAVALVTGAPPDRGLTLPLLWARRASRPPRIQPTEGVPDGFAAWIERLCAPDPADRFPDAPAALAALRAFDPAGEPETVPPPIEPVLAPSAALWSMRRPVLVGRDAACDALLGALEEVEAGHRPVVVAITGLTGVGRTRLLEWIVETALEQGRATVFRARCTRQDDGLAAAVTDRAGARDATGDERDLRLDRFGETANLPAGAVREALDGHDGRVRATVVRRLLAASAATRPVILALDDAETNVAVLELADAVAGDRGGGGVLVVLSVRTDGLDDPGVRAAWARLDGRARQIELPALDEAGASAVARSVLPLAPSALQRAVTLCEGAPQRLMQLLALWLDRNLLNPGPTGMVLAADAGLHVPDTFGAPWAARLDAVVASRGLPRVAIEVLALLGEPSRREDWVEACLELEVPTEGVAEALCAAGILEEVRGGWRFTRRELRSAAEDGASSRVATACVRVLARRSDADPERTGTLRARIGTYDEAARDLLEAARERLSSRSGEVAEVVARCLDALDAAGAPADDPRRAEAADLAARVQVSAASRPS